MTMYQCWIRIKGGSVGYQIFDIPMEVIGFNGRLKKWIEEHHKVKVIEIWGKEQQT